MEKWRTLIMRIPLEIMIKELERILLQVGFDKKQAVLCASIFTENSLVGVASHGLNRFPLFIDYIRQGYIKPKARAKLASSHGAWEQYDGHLGPGPLNAYDCTLRCMEIARMHGIGCVGLCNTNHWMRGGYFGWMAAEAGFAFIGWTNTTPNMPPWGGFDCRVGNNPLVMAVPRKDGPVVLDMAMSQFSYGRMETASQAEENLAVDGGYDDDGNLTRSPSAILSTHRPLPIGYWKGSGLAVLLDLFAALVSGGITTQEIGRREPEYGVSQVFIGIDMSQAASLSMVNRVVDQLIADLRTATPVEKDGVILYPGERALRTRRENLGKGIPVDPAVWDQVLSIA
jgi:3-dehydro-L-gulonate 2-dehydrogenase